MSRLGTLREWNMFLGTRDTEDASLELTKLVRVLDEAFDLVNGALKRLSGCPDHDTEWSLRSARSSLDEAAASLQRVEKALQRHDPDVA